MAKNRGVKNFKKKFVENPKKKYNLYLTFETAMQIPTMPIFAYIFFIFNISKKI